MTNQQERECPHCAELILAKATICKHCRSPLLSPLRKIGNLLGGLFLVSLALLWLYAHQVTKERERQRVEQFQQLMRDIDEKERDLTLRGLMHND